MSKLNITPRRVERKVVMGSHPSSPRFWSAWQRQGYEVSTAHRNPWSRREEFVDGRLVGRFDRWMQCICLVGRLYLDFWYCFWMLFSSFFLVVVFSIFLFLWIKKWRSEKVGSYMLILHHRILYHLDRIRWLATPMGVGFIMAPYPNPPNLGVASCAIDPFTAV